jgi:hypothetical protein
MTDLDRCALYPLRAKDTLSRRILFAQRTVYVLSGIASLELSSEAPNAGPSNFTDVAQLLDCRRRSVNKSQKPIVSSNTKMGPP